MLAAALGTYAAALVTIVASVAIGAGILAACGRHRWSWTAPAIGLAAATVIAWWTVRLPGEGLTALATLAVASAAGGALSLRRLEGVAAAARRCAPVLAISLAAVSIPFVVEGHFGILGTGFNVDMSQHLFAADWLSNPAAVAPGLFEQGYPLGPHALAVATGEVTGELATSFSGVTIAVPVLIALSALALVAELSLPRATIAAALTAFAYLAASYLAQGSFKELFEVCFLLGFVGWLAELRPPSGDRGRLADLSLAIPCAVLGAGALYAYSGPGLVWLAGTLLGWAGIELLRSRERAVSLRRAMPVAAAGLVALALLALPEIDRIGDFGGSVGTVSDRAGGDSGTERTVDARGVGDAQSSGPEREGPKFDNDLGNLFGQISPLEAFGIWPSGDFRVAPGDGAVPAIAFYAGALLGALALAIGVAAAIRRNASALLGALAAAAAIWLAARLASTPYTTAKALQMLAPVAMLVAAHGVLDPGFAGGFRERGALLRSALAAAFVGAAAVSSVLALANAPVGPEEYSPGVTALSDRFAGEPTLLLVPEEVLADQHGEEFYGWELREASEASVDELPVDGAAGSTTPAGTAFVLMVDGNAEAPFTNVAAVAASNGVTVWRVSGE